MTGYFTAAGRIRELVAVEILEQVVSMAVTVLLLSHWASGDPGRACCAVVGRQQRRLSCDPSVPSVSAEPGNEPASGPAGGAGTGSRAAAAGGPAFGPGRRFAHGDFHGRKSDRPPGVWVSFPSRQNPWRNTAWYAAWSSPTLMFPAAILFSLAELLVPELSRCAAGGRRKRIAYLTGRSLRVALLYGLAAGGILFTASEALGMVLFDNPLWAANYGALPFWPPCSMWMPSPTPM